MIEIAAGILLAVLILAYWEPILLFAIYMFKLALVLAAVAVACIAAITLFGVVAA